MIEPLPDGRWFVRIDGAGPVIVATKEAAEGAEVRLAAKVEWRRRAKTNYLLGGDYR